MLTSLRTPVQSQNYHRRPAIRTHSCKPQGGEVEAGAGHRACQPSLLREPQAKEREPVSKNGKWKGKSLEMASACLAHIQAFQKEREKVAMENLQSSPVEILCLSLSPLLSQTLFLPQFLKPAQKSGPRLQMMVSGMGQGRGRARRCLLSSDRRCFLTSLSPPLLWALASPS